MISDKITDLQLEQFLLNELPEEEMEIISEMTESDPLLKDRIEKIKRSDLEILEKYPAEMMKIRIREGIISMQKNPVNKTAGLTEQEIRHSTIRIKGFLAGKSRRALYSLTAASLTAAAALIMFLYVPGIMNLSTNNMDNDIVRIKGMQPGLFILRKAGSRTEQIENLSKAFKGDLLQIGYTSTGDYRYGVILSIDGRGAVTLHYPESENSDTLLQTNRKVMLQRAYELDDSPGFEKFILILSRDPVDVKSIIEKAKVLAESGEGSLNDSITASGTMSEYSLTLKK